MGDTGKGIGGIIGTIISFSGLAITTEELANIISIVSGIVGLVITLCSIVVIPFIKWIVKSKKDGKITEEELDELKGLVDEAKEELKKNKKEGGK